MTFLRGSHAALLILGVTTLSAGLGVVTLESQRFLGALFLLAAVAVGLAGPSRRANLSGKPSGSATAGGGSPLEGKGGTWRRIIAWVGPLVFISLIFATRRPELWLLFAAGSVYCTLMGQQEPESRSALLCHAGAAAMFAGAYLVYRCYPLAWQWVEAFAQYASRTMGSLAGSGVEYGATTAGLWIVLALLCLGFSHIVHARHKEARVLAILFCAFIVIFTPLYLGFGEPGIRLLVRSVSGWFPGYPGSPRLFDNAAVVALHGPLLLLVAGLVVTAWLLPRVDLRPATFALRGGGWTSGLMFAAFLILGLAAAWEMPLRRPASMRILFYGHGMLDWRTPTHGQLGIGRSGMFGLLPRYLEAAGWKTERLARSDVVTSRDLENKDVLVVINPTRKFTPEEQEAIWGFVRAGGGLLVLGDHTDLSGIMEPLNTLLQPVSISFRFDSAFSIRHWSGDYDCFSHPVCRRLDSSNDHLQQSTGASLELGRGSYPVVVAKHAFSDAGKRSNTINAFLGDYRYQTGELLSDVAVIAGASYGAGKVIVFGDTSAFQNTAIARSASFLADVFSYVGNRDGGGFLQRYQNLAATLVGIAVVLLGFFVPGIRYLATLSAGFAIGALAGGLPARRFEAVPFESPRLAFIDAMHVNQFSLEMWLADSIGGLTTNLGRNGFLPLMLRNAPIEAIRQGKILFCIVPSKPYSRHELDVIRQFMEEGGLVVVSVGYEEKNAAMGLLALADCDIDSAPLGPIPIYRKTQDQAAIQSIMQEPHFMEAWPILAAKGIDTSYYRSGESDVIGFRKIGAGGMLVIADSKFLLDKTLEEEADGWPGNVKLMSKLLGELVPRAP